MQSKSTLKITGALLALSLIVNQHAILTPLSASNFDPLGSVGFGSGPTEWVM